MREKNVYIYSFVLVVTLVVTFAAYSIGLPGEFFFDDFPNIVQSEPIQVANLSIGTIWELLNSGSAGPFKRPLPVLSFGLNYYFSGMSPGVFKVTNIVFHLLNGVLVFILLKKIFLYMSSAGRINCNNHKRLAYLSAFISSVIWVVHPLHVSGVLYVVQRMNIMAATFSLLALILYSYGRIGLNRGFSTRFGVSISRGCILSSLVLLALSILCKENGVLTIIVAFIIEAFVFRFKTPGKIDRYLVFTYFGVFLIGPAIYAVLHVFNNPAWVLGGYKYRDFTFIERVLTQTRLLIYYIQLTFLPSLSELSFFHDDFETSKSLLQPVSTIFSIISLAIGAVVPIFYSRKNVCCSILSFGVLWFLAGHLLESSVFPLEMVYEHRNYLPIIGLISGAVFTLLYIFERLNVLSNKRAFVVIGLLVVALLSITALRAERWSSTLKSGIYWVQNHPKSFKSHLVLAYSYEIISKYNYDQFFNKATEHFLISAGLNTNSQVGLLALIELHSQTGDVINPMWIQNVSNRLAEKPLHASISIGFNSYYLCIQEEKCHDLGVFEELISIAIGNKKSQPKTIAELHSIKGAYLLRVKKDINGAISEFLYAVQKAPYNIRNQLSLARCISLGGDHVQARRMIKILRENDHYNIHTIIIDKTLEFVNNDEVGMKGQ